jgi:magnesium transporter
MRRAIVATEEGITYPIDLGAIVEAMKAPEKVLWLDITNPAEEDFRLLLEFGFHGLSVEDVRATHTAAKLDEYDHYVFQVVMVPVEVRAREIELFEVEIFYLKGTIVTVHDRPWPAIDALWEAVEGDPENELGKGAQILYHNVVDRAVRDYFPILDSVDDEVESIEHQVLEHAADPKTLKSLFHLRRSVRVLMRATRNQRESVQRLAAGTVRSLRKETCYLFRDVHDRLILLHDALDDHRETLVGLRDTYLGVINNRMSEIMKTLTVYSAMLLPLAFITGLWGMNVPVPFADKPWAYWVILTACLAVSLGTLAFVARRGWLRRMS